MITVRITGITWHDVLHKDQRTAQQLELRDCLTSHANAPLARRLRDQLDWSSNGCQPHAQPFRSFLLWMNCFYFICCLDSWTWKNMQSQESCRTVLQCLPPRSGHLWPQNSKHSVDTVHKSLCNTGGTRLIQIRIPNSLLVVWKSHADLSCLDLPAWFETRRRIFTWCYFFELSGKQVQQVGMPNDIFVMFCEAIFCKITGAPRNSIATKGFRFHLVFPWSSPQGLCTKTRGSGN